MLENLAGKRSDPRPDASAFRSGNLEITRMDYLAVKVPIWDSSSQSRSLLQDSSMDFESPDVLRRIQTSGLGWWYLGICASIWV